jgi:glyoxylase-like metal-dependent hydrolase (beta-lactamase superfamily II)
MQQEQERQTDDQPSLAAFIQDFDRTNHVHRAPLVVDAPTRTFDHVLHLELGNRTVRLLHLPGHTRDSTAVLLPNDGLMFVGDMLSDTTTPQVSDSGDYLRSLDLIQQFVSAGVVRTVVPGRGRVLCGAAEIAAMIAADRSYILGVRDQLAFVMRRYRPTSPNMELIERSVSNWR